MKEIIDNLPTIVQYFISGAIFISLFNFIINKKNNDYQYFIFKSVVVSFIINTISQYILSIFYNTINNINLIQFSIVLSILFAYISSQLYLSVGLSKILLKLNIFRNVKGNFWNDIFDYNHGNYITVYLKNEELIYYGEMAKHDETDGKCFVLLKNFKVYDYDGNECEKSDDREATVLFLDESSRIDIKYSPKSKII